VIYKTRHYQELRFIEVGSIVMQAYVSQIKRDQLHKFMEKMGVSEADLTEKFILGSGKGGQKVNKTASCVQLMHSESGIKIKCQRGRSRELNRYYARKELCEQLEERKLGVLSRRRQAAEKIRRQKRRRSRRQKERMLEAKHQRSAKKQLRRPVRETE
jgi:protein subunit release factor B